MGAGVGDTVVSGCIHVSGRQELTRREVVDVTHLEIPAELMGLLEAAAGERDPTPAPHPRPRGYAIVAHCAAASREVNAGCVVLVPPPPLQPDPQLTLPLDINDYPMAKYVRGHFQVRWVPWPGGGEPVPAGSRLLGSPRHPGRG